MPDEFLAGYPSLSAEIKQDKGAWIAAIAFEHARRQAALSEAIPAERVGLVLGCALAGQLGMIAFANEVRQQSARFVSPIHFPQTVGNYVAGALARACNIRGPNSTIAAGLASGVDAIAQGCALLTADAADVVYAGGSDALSRDLAVGLAQPGMVLSEGACLFVLERRSGAASRGARPLAAVRRGARHAAGAPLPEFPEHALVVSAGIAHPSALVIEQRIGRCFAALSAAAIAAAIGQRPGNAVIFADADGAHTTVLELTVGEGG